MEKFRRDGRRNRKWGCNIEKFTTSFVTQTVNHESDERYKVWRRGKM